MAGKRRKYGPHNFGEWKIQPGNDATVRDCACGAYEIACGQSGQVFQDPCEENIADHNQCRLNPIS